MNAAHLTTATHPTTQITVLSASHIKINKLGLPQQSTPRYDVIVRLCRPLTNYESHQLIAHRSIGLNVSPDPLQLIVTHTTVEEVRDRLPEFHELLTAAATATAGHTAQDTATQAKKAIAMEEARRQILVSDINPP